CNPIVPITHFMCGPILPGSLVSHLVFTNVTGVIWGVLPKPDDGSPMSRPVQKVSPYWHLMLF
ncbi:MAG TPA: hypothetical protein VF338_07470, partial [Leptolinea sp.]